MVQKPPAADAPKVELDLRPEDFPPAEGANWFHFTFQGPEAQLLVGVVDLWEVHQLRQRVAAKGGKGEFKLRPDVTHRFLMSVSGFLVLKAQIDEIFKKMEAGGMLERIDGPQSR